MSDVGQTSGSDRFVSKPGNQHAVPGSVASSPHRGWRYARHVPEAPPAFSITLTPSITMPRSTAFTMS